MKLHHLGIAVHDLDKTAFIFSKLLNVEVERISLPERKLELAVFKLGDFKLEFITPGEGETVISKFLHKRGDSIHHIAVGVSNLREYLKKLNELGIKVIEGPRKGAWGHEVAFLNPQDTGNILIELVEAE